ncbi:MAG: TIR domain-containing protein [Candidatus Aminicenantes bacterium]|nr:TIR domain-containing protein [Candidatus Aminicenantes bacterium]NIM80992.1 TIR domain-containing protein [Candidatus Aminicenantes bacterium]NIN20369.1 TIR domain-containing protein [Candidatus Aminicenantes bacterium]NIN44142.1 TIR domain-containing protein [Candidatus Aminicenantes bacterium]NIN86960.1 TIR domain-containing protein [Candidatus Aminicenantes bacterium]
MGDNRGRQKEMDWDSFFYDLSAGNIIPVIGNDLSLLKGEGGTPVSLYDYIIKELIKIKKIQYTKQGIGEIVLAYPGIGSTIKTIYGNIDEEKFYTRPLEKLAEITDFRFFVSTTVDDLLEKAIRNVCSYIDSQLNVINYSLQAKSPDSNEKKSEVTVFNLLGNLDDLMNSALDEEKVLEYLFSITWGKCENHPQAEYFLKHVNEKILLFIGCDFPDWLMRFVIRIVSNRRLSEKTFKDYIVCNVCDTNADRQKLKDFLDQCEKDFIIIGDGRPNNVEAFVDMLYSKWKESKKEDKHIQYKGSVFLSYYHKDEKEAADLKNKLEGEGVEVWFDKEDLHAGEHKKKIWDAINKCEVFIPVISGECLGAAESYARKYEWPEAEMIFRYKKKSGQVFNILPCFIGDVDRKDNRIPGFIRDFTIFDLNEKDKILDEVKSLLKLRL